MDCKSINVLGTTYIIKFGTSDEFPLLAKMDGYTDESIKLIVVDNMTRLTEEADAKRTCQVIKKALLDTK